MPSSRLICALALVIMTAGGEAIAEAPPAEAAREQTTLRHALGVAMGSALYHTHLFLGTAADGYKGKALTAEQVRGTLKASARVTQDLVDELGRAKSFTLPPEELAKLEELIAIGEMVVREVRLLHGVVQTGTPEAERAFAEHRQRVRVRLGALLGL